MIRPSIIEALNGSVVTNTLGGSALPQNQVTALQGLDNADRWDACVLGSLLQQLARIHPQPVCVSLQVSFLSERQHNHSDAVNIILRL